MSCPSTWPRGPLCPFISGPPKHRMIQLGYNPHVAYPLSEVSIFLAHQSLLVSSPVSTLAHSWTPLCPLSCTGFTDYLSPTSLSLSSHVDSAGTPPFSSSSWVESLSRVPPTGATIIKISPHLSFQALQPTVPPWLAHTGPIDCNWPFRHMTPVPQRWEVFTSPRL